MGMAIDWGNQIIQITSPTTEVDMQTLHDFIEDELARPEGLNYPAIITPEGKIEDPTNPGVYSQIIIVLQSPWQIQFWGGSGYTRIYGGKLVGGYNDQPLKATGTAGDITVLESPVDGLTVVSDQSSLLQQEDIENIATELWTKDISGITDSGSAAKTLSDIATDITQIASDLARAKGLTHHNQYIDQTVFDGDRLTSARIRLYTTESSVGTDSDVLATYTLTAVYESSLLKTYKVAEVVS